MGVIKEFVVGQAVRCGRYVGVVCLVVPPMRNPKREMKAAGIKALSGINQYHSDQLPLRDHESYIVKSVRPGGFIRYTWPRLGRMEAIDG